MNDLPLAAAVVCAAFLIAQSIHHTGKKLMTGIDRLVAANAATLPILTVLAAQANAAIAIVKSPPTIVGDNDADVDAQAAIVEQNNATFSGISASLAAALPAPPAAPAAPPAQDPTGAPLAPATGS